MRTLTKLLPRFLIIFLLLVIADQAVGRGLAALYRSSTQDITRGLGDRSAVVILGSSRAHHHYNSEIIGERLGVSVWNYGMNGQFGPTYPYGVMQVILSTYTPRLVVIDVQGPVFYSGPEDFARLSVLAPHAQQPAVRDVLAHRSRWESLKLLSRVYPYNSRLLQLINRRDTEAGQDDSRGYIGLPGTISDELLKRGEPLRVGTQVVPDTGANATSPVDSLKYEYLARMASELHSRGIPLIAVRSPTLVRSEWARARDARHEAELRALFERVNVPFIDFSIRAFPDFDDTRLFRDWVHLNPDGADRFSNAIADSLRRYLH
jgi:hypothetical protein